jgi:hypothetical protein
MSGIKTAHPVPAHPRRASGLAPILMALASVVSASTAMAQKVVILEIDRDPGKLRAQIEKAVGDANIVEVIALSQFKEAAAKKKLKGLSVMTPAAVAKVSTILPLDAAVSGEIDGKQLHVFIYNRTGEQVWTRDIPLSAQGLLTKQLAQKLAKAIVAAGEAGAQQPAAKPSKDDANGDTTASDSKKDSAGDTKGSSDRDKTAAPEIDLTAVPRSASVSDRQQVDAAPEERDSDLEELIAKRKKVRVGPPLLKVSLTGANIVRTHCMRPGVAACADYDRLSTANQPVPQGLTVDYGGGFGYLGFALGAEVFPLASFDSAILKGFGVLAGFQFGSAVSDIQESTTQGMGMKKRLPATDVSWDFELAWRFFFQLGTGNPKPVGYVGLRGGLLAKRFNVDSSVTLLLPSSIRVSPTGVGFGSVGLEASLPVIPQFRIELGGRYFFGATTAEEQAKAYGNLQEATGVSSTVGFGVDAGFAGHIYGPIGWTVMTHIQFFKDTYRGQGSTWTVCDQTQCGGTGEELFINVNWGLTASF